MATLEKRISDLETQTASDEQCVQLYFCDVGEDAQQARDKAGIPPDSIGKIVRVQFVERTHAVKEQRNAID